MPRPLHFGGYRPAPGPKFPDPYRRPHFPRTRSYEEELEARTTSLLDYEKLPAPGELQGMELAWREIPVARAVAAQEVRRRLGWSFGASLFLALLFSQAPLRPPLTRPLLATFLWVVTYFGLLTIGRHPLQFYRDWLFTYPRLTPTTRKNPPRPHRFPCFPDPLRFLALVFAVIALGPLTPGATVAGVSLVALLGLLHEARARTEIRSREALAARGRDYPARRRVSLFSEILPLYISHGLARGTPPRLPPGVWRFPRALQTRTNDILWPTLLLATALAVTLSFGVAPEALAYVLRGYPPDQVGLIVAAARATPLGWVGPLRALDPWAAVYVGLWAGSFPIVGSYGLLVVLFQPTLRRLARLERDCERDDGLDATEPDVDGTPTPRSEMQWHIDRTRQSTHRAVLPERGEVTHEKDHLFLGEEPFQKFPILLHEGLLERHAYLSGSTGVGKTHLGLLPMMLQLLRPKGDPDNPEPPPPMIIVDLKGDWAMFHTLRLEVAKRWWTDPTTNTRKQQAFRFFSLERGKATDYFNFFSSFGIDHEHPYGRDHVTPGELAEIFLDVFNLNHGSGYGRGYYSEINRGLLYDCVQRIKADPKRWNAVTFADMARECRAPAGERGPGNNPLELLAHLMAFTECEQLCTPHAALDPAAKERAILMPRVLAERQVVYFWLPVSSGSRSTRDVALLALWSLWRAAQKRTSTHPVYLFVDELQRVISKGFGDMMAQARSPARIRLISASQSPAQLNTPDEDFRELIITNAAVRYIFQMSNEDDVDRLIRFSGTRLEERHQYSKTLDPLTGLISPGVTTAIERVPRLTLNDIVHMNKHAYRYFLELPGAGAGYSQFQANPIYVEADFILPEEVYRERDRPNTWPDPLPGQCVPSVDTVELENDSRTAGDRMNQQDEPPFADFTKGDDEFQDRYRDFEEKFKRS